MIICITVNTKQTQIKFMPCSIKKRGFYLITQKDTSKSSAAAQKK
jgi:hypothetical protein